LFDNGTGGSALVAVVWSSGARTVGNDKQFVGFGLTNPLKYLCCQLRSVKDKKSHWSLHKSFKIKNIGGEFRQASRGRVYPDSGFNHLPALRQGKL
jgi:hypothetical protein